MYATPAQLTIALNHAQNTVNAAAALHGKVVERINQLRTAAPQLCEDFVIGGKADNLMVGNNVCSGRLPEELGLHMPALVSAGSQPAVADRAADAQTGYVLQPLTFGREKKKAKTKSFPLDLPARECYSINVDVRQENGPWIKVRVTAYPDQPIIQN